MTLREKVKMLKWQIAAKRGENMGNAPMHFDLCSKKGKYCERQIAMWCAVHIFC